MTVYPSALLWLDLETANLPPKSDPNNYKAVQIIEVAVIVTDFDLQPHFGYSGVVGMHDGIRDALKANADDYVLKMHLANGLLKESKESTDTLRIIESEIIGLLKSKTTQDKGEFVLAGSGVSTFDFQVIKAHMPELASWLAYYTFDTGTVRRVSKMANRGRDVFPVIPESFKDGEKAHRALPDVKAHIKEAAGMYKTFRWLLEQQVKEG